MKCLLVAKEKQADLQRASESSSPLWHLPPLSPVKLEVVLVLMWSWHHLHLLKSAQHKGCQKWDVNAIHLINGGIKEKSWNWSFFLFLLEIKNIPGDFWASEAPQTPVKASLRNCRRRGEENNHFNSYMFFTRQRGCDTRSNHLAALGVFVKQRRGKSLNPNHVSFIWRTKTPGEVPASIRVTPYSSVLYNLKTHKGVAQTHFITWKDKLYLKDGSSHCDMAYWFLDSGLTVSILKNCRFS